MNERNQNVTVGIRDWMYSVEFLVSLAIAAILAVRVKGNYFFLSLLCFSIITVFESGKVHFYKVKPVKKVLKEYPYITKLTLQVLLTISIILSWRSLKACVYSIILSALWTEYIKLFKRRKCPRLGIE